jgi:hypothetical protein
MAMNTLGNTVPSVGLVQRASPSKPMILLRSRCTSGWKWTSIPPVAMAVRSSRSIAVRRSTWVSISGSKKRMPEVPSALAR